VSDTEAEVTPALFEHAARVYKEMGSRSRTESVATVEDPNMHGLQVDPNLQITVYEGHLTRLFSDLGVANPYYTKIIQVLKDMGCLVQIRRGGGVALSKWQLCKEPTEEDFNAIINRKHRPKGKTNVLEQRVNDLMKLVSGLQDTQESQERRIQVLERKVGAR
jgi:hypothetical protein